MKNPNLWLRCYRCGIYFNPDRDYNNPRDMSYRFCWQCQSAKRQMVYELIVLAIVIMVLCLLGFYYFVFIPATGGM